MENRGGLFLRILICGTRTVFGENVIDDAVSRSRWNGLITRVVSGGQKRYDRKQRTYYGADYWGERWAFARDIPVDRYPADWNKHGKYAGPIRNQQMIDTNPDGVIAIWDGQSADTRDLISRAEVAGIEVFVYQYEVENV